MMKRPCTPKGWELHTARDRESNLLRDFSPA